MKEREICYIHQEWFSLKIKQTHCRCLATTHPAGQTSRLSFIQRRPPLCDSHSKRHTYTRTHIQLPGRERKRELHHPSMNAFAAASPWKDTCRLQEHMQILWDFSNNDITHHWNGGGKKKPQKNNDTQKALKYYSTETRDWKQALLTTYPPKTAMMHAATQC